VFAHQAVFLDIEADLALRHDDWVPSLPTACPAGEARQRRAREGIAAVALLDASGPRVLLQGRDLADAPAAMPGSCLLVTFNGGSFDLPALERAFPGWRRPAAHVDLRPLLARLGHRGGLKAIEQQTRVGRPAHLCGLPGHGVVWLWRRAVRGDPQALRLFAEYNLYDAVNLRPLMCLAYNGLAARTGVPFSPIDVPERATSSMTSRSCSWRYEECAGGAREYSGPKRFHRCPFVPTNSPDPFKETPMNRLISTTLLGALLAGPACGGKDQPEGPGSTAGSSQPVTVYLGTYTRGWACPPPETNGATCTSKGIYRATFEPKTGTLSEPALAAEADNPSYLTVSADGRTLFAVNEVDDYKGEKSGAVSAFAIDGAGGLSLINQLSSHGADPCHLSIAGGGHTLLVANYTGGNVSSYRIGAGGELSEGITLADPGEHGPHMNQDAAHAHFIIEGPTPNLVYVADLGLDKVLLYDLDPATSKLSPHAAQPFVVVTPPGSGPRHIAIHPTRRFLYTNNELGTSASVFARSPDSGGLEATSVQSTSSIPLPFSGGSDNAEIQISGDGRFAYISNRGDHNSISTFSIDPASGKLTLIENVPTGGRIPRDFKIDPSGQFLLVGHQTSDEMMVFAIDRSSGKITRRGPVVTLSKVVNFAFLPAK
jgi:6-phosphogluconolactonase